MSMADVLRIFLLIIGAQIVFISYWLVAESLLPSFVERCSHQYTHHGFLSTLIGLAILGPLLLIAVGVLGKSANPIGHVLGVTLIGGPVLLGLLGSAGLSRRIGRGLPSAIDSQQPWRQGLRGGIVLSMTFLLPFAGWFFVLPWTVVSGLGAAVRSLRQVKSPAEAMAPESKISGVTG